MNKTYTAPQALRIILRVAALTIVAAVAALVMVKGSVEDMTWDQAPATDWSTQPTIPEALIQEHGCWTGQGPVGVIPGHVVYAGQYRGAKATGQALDAVFGKPSPLDASQVQAFCR